MTTTVNGESPLAGLGPAEITLQVGLEQGDVGALEDRLSGVLERSPLGTDLGVQISLQTPRVIRYRIFSGVRPEVDRVS